MIPKVFAFITKGSPEFEYNTILFIQLIDSFDINLGQENLVIVKLIEFSLENSETQHFTFYASGFRTE